MVTKKTKKKTKSAQYVRTSQGNDGAFPLWVRQSMGVLLAVLVLGGFVWGLIQGFEWIEDQLFSKNDSFEIQKLVISSDGKLSEDLIREYSNLSEGMNLFAVEFDEIEASLSKVPTIERVILERDLPHTLIIKVIERMPVARIEGATGRRFSYAVDRYGYVLPPSRTTTTLPLIEGIESDLRLGEEIASPDIQHALKIIAICDSTSSLRSFVAIEKMNFASTKYIRMYLKDGVQVRMPRFAFNTKLKNLATTLNIAKGMGKKVKEVDLTLGSSKIPVSYY